MDATNTGEGQASKEPGITGGGASALLRAHESTVGNVGPIGVRTKRAYRCSKCQQPKPCGCRNTGTTQNVNATPVPAMALFNEENTGRLVALPFTLAAVATDYDDWRLDDKEQKELAITGSVALNEWVRVDPKWVALCLFSLSLASVATAKAIGYQGELRARQIRKMQEAQRKGKAGGEVPGGPPKPPIKDADPFTPPEPGAIS